MTFREMPGRTGIFFIPDDASPRKKHPCEDCYSCQTCSDERCSWCLGNKRLVPETPQSREQLDILTKKMPSYKKGKEGNPSTSRIMAEGEEPS